MNICIVGTGYVGLVAAACFAEMGNNVTCVDINESVVTSLKDGVVHIYEPGLEPLVKRNYSERRLHFTTKLEEGLLNSAVVFIAVGTPSNPDGSCNLEYVHGVAREIGRLITRTTIVVDKSTVPVGTADAVRDIISEELVARGESVEFHVVSNPEFLKEGDAINDFMKPDRVVVGTDNDDVAETMRILYAPFARSRDKIIVMGVRSAEMTKYAANCMLATKISFINEIANICERVGADVRDVRVGIGSDSRIGYQFIYPGVGYGGSCFPKDVKALINTAKGNEFTPHLLDAVEQVNERQKVRMAERIEEYFEPLGGVSGKTLAVWGLAFKANTDDMREAASINIIERLTAKGMYIKAYDPVAASNARGIFSGNQNVSIVSEQYEATQCANALLVVTEWNQFRTPDFELIKSSLKSAVLFDGRNLYSSNYLGELGYQYFAVGK
ncbi:UDP-glucose/GDP-mannose dehydrogenase family protein [Desulfovibrio mangrovi]|uniref:UDP-glucose dehydrogenase family protein n=1 Tax=Desulfovibrio mangrovi TaxID=2976983 RepID=UPI0022460DD1|nr:UDP-glucose/GDP-mannose dehydrogenase family protein [Desulfovibrio mangrovi]UZP67605.1 UDP-glucose/GDP-mannose dehydrogenase family protein [Desulfovibrio mangrovi]